MFITTSYTGGTNKASVRGGPKHIVFYTSTSTVSEAAAARAVVRKYWSKAAAQTIRELKDPAEIASIVGDFQRSPQRKQVFTLWTFDPSAK